MELLLSTLSFVFASEATDEINDIVTSGITPSLLVVIATLISLFILIFVVTFFAYKPVKGILTKRQDYIENNIKEAEHKNTTASYNNRKSELELSRAQEDARFIVDKAVNDANEKQSKILLQAKDRAKDIVEDANKSADQIVKQREDELKKSVIELSIELSQKIISNNITKEDNQKLIDDFIKSLEIE